MPQLILNPLSGEFDFIRRLGEKRRIGVDLAGDINGVNRVFSTPTKFMHEAGQEDIAVYYNGQRLRQGALNDYVAGESGGGGTGYDSILLNFATKATPDLDRLTVDYTEQ